jgi:glutaredoxin-like YruB-family protein
MKTLLLMIIVIQISVSLSEAEMYQWIADDGSVTFKDTPPPASKKRKKVKVYNDSYFDPAPPPPTASAGRSNKSATKPASGATANNKRFSGTVEIYVTDWCGYCKQALSYMSSKGIPYVAYNIEKDNSAKQRHKELGGRGVPLIIIGANKMSGFSEENLEYYLNNSK